MNGLPLSLGAVAALAVAGTVARRGSLSLLDYASMSDDELVENEDRQRTSLKRRREQRAKMRPPAFRVPDLVQAQREIVLQVDPQGRDESRSERSERLARR